MSSTPNANPSAAAAVAETTPPVPSSKTPEAAKPAEASTPAEVKAEIRRLKLKLDGADVELPEDQVIALAQRGAGSDKRFNEASALRKQAEQVLEFIQANPKEALTKLGIDLRKFSEETLTEILQREAESPEQKKIRETEEKLRRYEEQEKAKEASDKKKAEDDAKEAKKRAMSEKEKEIMNNLDNLFTTALKEVDLPKDEYTVSRMITLYKAKRRIEREMGIKDSPELSPQALAQLVKEDVEREDRNRVDRHKTDTGYDGDKLMAWLGPDVIKAISKAQIKKLKSEKEQKFSTPMKPPETEISSKPKSGGWKTFSMANRKPNPR